MKILHHDRKVGELKVEPESMEDLWVLERVLAPGDVLAGKSVRRFKAERMRGEAGEKKPVYLEIRAEQIELDRTVDRLRVTGPILAGSPEEYIQIGEHHTLNIEPGYAVKITKPWTKLELDRVYEARREKPLNVAILALDEDSALLAGIRGFGLAVRAEVFSGASKRDPKREEKMKAYFRELSKLLKESKAERYVIAGPGFTRQNFHKWLRDEEPEIAAKAVVETASSAGESGAYEVLKRGVLTKLAGEARIERELGLFEELMAEIGRDTGLAVYGRPQVAGAVTAGAVAKLFITDKLLRDTEVSELAEMAEKLGAQVTVFSTEHAGGEGLQKLGGMAAILRYKLS